MTEYAPPPAFPPGYGSAPTTRTNVLSIISLVASLVGIFLWFIGPIGGIVCGHIALAQIKRTREGGHGMARAGLIVGYILLGLQIVITIAYVVLIATIVANSPQVLHSLSPSDFSS